MAVDLLCSVCNEQYDAGRNEPWKCGCGNPLEYDFEPHLDGDQPPDTDYSPSEGLWEFKEFIPIEQNITLREAFTPMVETPRWDTEFKLEYVFPSGSFKDRGASTMLSRASELGVSKVVDDSSGNAGSAVAMYAAQTDMDSKVFVPATVKSQNCA